MKTIFRFIAFIAIVFCLNACKATQKEVDRSQQTKEPDVVPDNSRTSLDWNGIYTGTLPCADCEGIQTVVKLERDLSYVIQTRYVGKSDSVYESRGTFSWNSQGNKITSKAVDPNESPSMYQVGENKLTQLDLNGNKISGELADRYILVKVYPGITEKYWKLTEIYGKQVLWDETYRKEPHVILKSEANRLVGNSGCNSLVLNKARMAPLARFEAVYLR